jgi:hypothetical protein
MITPFYCGTKNFANFFPLAAVERDVQGSVRTERGERRHCTRQRPTASPTLEQGIRMLLLNDPGNGRPSLTGPMGHLVSTKQQ